MPASPAERPQGAPPLAACPIGFVPKNLLCQGGKNRFREKVEPSKQQVVDGLHGKTFSSYIAVSRTSGKGIRDDWIYAWRRLSTEDDILNRAARSAWYIVSGSRGGVAVLLERDL